MTKNTAAAIKIYCPERHKIKLKQKEGPAKDGLAPMQFDAAAHGWICDWQYGAGERGKYARRCEQRRGFSFVFVDESAAMQLELGRPIENLKLTPGMVRMIQLGLAVVPWPVDPELEKEYEVSDIIKRMVTRAPRPKEDEDASFRESALSETQFEATQRLRAGISRILDAE